MDRENPVTTFHWAQVDTGVGRDTATYLAERFGGNCRVYVEHPGEAEEVASILLPVYTLLDRPTIPSPEQTAKELTPSEQKQRRKVLTAVLRALPGTEKSGLPWPDQQLGQPNPVRRALEQLGKRDREVLEVRFGLAGERPKKLAEIAELSGLSVSAAASAVYRALDRLDIDLSEAA
jgi:hypothetical protein